jgi:hypothetical protein
MDELQQRVTSSGPPPNCRFGQGGVDADAIVLRDSLGRLHPLQNGRGKRVAIFELTVMYAGGTEETIQLSPDAYPLTVEVRSDVQSVIANDAKVVVVGNAERVDATTVVVCGGNVGSIAITAGTANVFGDAHRVNIQTGCANALRIERADVRTGQITSLSDRLTGPEIKDRPDPIAAGAATLEREVRSTLADIQAIQRHIQDAPPAL